MAETLSDIVASSEAERLATGFVFTEGPLWHPDGSVANGRHFADMSSEVATNGVPDGMKVDIEGRVYCTGPDGCWVFHPSGHLIDIIRLPEFPANCAWGGSDHQTLFFTANTSIYSLRMKTPGTQIPRA
jgi:gluconolactonase